MNFERIETLKNKYLPNGSFKANLFTMTTGKIISQVIPILLVPVLTRMYSPEEFGIFAIFLAVIGIVSFLANGRYNLAIMLPKKNNSVMRLFSLSVFLNILFSILLALLVFVFRIPIANLLNLDAPFMVLYLIPLGVFLLGLFEPLYYLGLRRRVFKILSAALIFQFTLIALLKIVFSYWDIGTFGLIYGHIVGYTLGVLFLIYMLYRKKAFLGLRLSIDRKRIAKIARFYKQFPMYSLPADMMNEFSRQLPKFLLNNFFGSAIVGHFSLTERVMGSPVVLISGGVRDVFREKASSDYRESGSCKNIFVATLKKLALFSIVPFILLYILAPILVPIIFGQEWAPAGDYIRIMSIMFFFRFLVSPVKSVLYITGKQVYRLVWEIVAFLSIFFSFWLGYRYFDEYMAITLYSLVLSFLYVILLIISYRFTEDKDG
jgi:O-antigen/teichoic acid export membrane protein